MNRLIIIGNGFDLAHGMKTSFKNFITDYYNNASKIFYQKDEYEDKLLSIKHAQNYDMSAVFTLNSTGGLPEALKELDNNMNVDITVKSEILKKINISIETKNWVDIEMEYFNILGESIGSKRFSVSEFNEEFDFLKTKLMDYLRNQQNDFSGDFDLDPFVSCFTQNIRYRELNDREVTKDIIPESLYFINFNYTDTILPYQLECNKHMIAKFNYIHGSLDGKEGAPIFGFGDEFDKKFLEFEDLRDNEYFKHIKSFDYSKNQNYSSLLRFIESDEFQVHIYGHSCGISDRTMLRSIFESDYCKSIKIFYHERNENENDFVDKTYEIYRHFSNKGEMRRKVVSLELCEPMPQPVRQLADSEITV